MDGRLDVDDASASQERPGSLIAQSYLELRGCDSQTAHDFTDLIKAQNSIHELLSPSVDAYLRLQETIQEVYGPMFGAYRETQRLLDLYAGPILAYHQQSQQLITELVGPALDLIHNASHAQRLLISAYTSVDAVFSQHEQEWRFIAGAAAEALMQFRSQEMALFPALAPPRYDRFIFEGAYRPTVKPYLQGNGMSDEEAEAKIRKIASASAYSPKKPPRSASLREHGRFAFRRIFLFLEGEENTE